MTASQSNLFERLVALCAGPPTGDPLQDTAREALLSSAKCIAEMNTTGFDTENLFDDSQLRSRMAGTTPFTVASLRTATVYLVVVTAQVDDVYEAAVQIYTPGKVTERFYGMTLVRAANGSIRANPRR